MSLKSRLALLAGVLLVLFLGTVQFLRVRERNQSAAVQATAEASRLQLIGQWLDLTNQPLHRFVRDFSEWPALAGFLARPNPAWANANLRDNLANYDAHALWVLNPAGQVVYAAQTRAGPPLDLPALPEDTAAGDGSYFVESRDGPLQVWTAWVRSGTNPVPSGRLVVCRAWTAEYLTRLDRLTDAHLSLGPPETGRTSDGTTAVVRVLHDARGAPLRVLLATPTRAGAAGGGFARDLHLAYTFALFAALLVAALWLALRYWVLRPLDLIRESLARNDAARIGPLLADRAEFGGIARLVESSFAQKKTLEATIHQHQLTEAALRESEKTVRHSLEIRARMARDLHDGVIQSIYAAGLGLESAIAQFETDPAGARARLQTCRQSLNDVIREVRAFINGIEPDEVHSRGFAHELDALARTMRNLWPVEIHVDVDPAAAGRLSAAQEMHALHMVRECVSNAVRHGHARTIRVRLAREGEGAELVIADDGSGFDPAASRGSGSGLGNLESRARELGGTLELHSTPGRGTDVRVRFATGGPA